MKRSWWRSSLYYLVPLAVILLIWLPLLRHYHVPDVSLSAETITASRHVPEDVLLHELSTMVFFDDVTRLSKDEIVEVAEHVLRGTFDCPGFSKRHIVVPFSTHDIDQGPPVWRLAQACLLVPRLLLQAHRITKRDDFLLMARDVILAWASYERRKVLPSGYLWNDHAIAERALALADFWALYRRHRSYETRVAQDILQFAARSGMYLANPSHFTVSTNHGVMQNLALWHLALAFPLLPNSERNRHLALDRLREQMGFYLNGEGVVLEHSAGYHRAGVHFLSMAFRYMSLHGLSIPDEWRYKYEKAKEFYAFLRRPDGSLPAFGDTSNRTDRRGPGLTNVDTSGRSTALSYGVDWMPPQTRGLYPAAGYAVWWDGRSEWPNPHRLSQTVVVWSHYPDRAHKHADEMSVILWARGHTWWTNTGYWPYGSPERFEAEAWMGSNAPHLVDEPYASERVTTLRAHGWSEDIAVLDLERRGPRGYVARRQVLRLPLDLWIVTDYTSGDERDRSRTVWTTSHNVRMSDGPNPHSWDLQSDSADVVLTKFIFGSSGVTIVRHKGSRKPFVGWEVVNKQGMATSALVVEHPVRDSWVVTLWMLKNRGSSAQRLVSQPHMQSWNGPEDWTVALPMAEGVIRVSRQPTQVLLSRDSGSTRVLPLTSPDPINQEIAETQELHARALRKYPRFSDHIEYRVKATSLSLFLLVLQEAFFFVHRRNTWKHHLLLRAFSVLAWMALGSWLLVFRVRLI